MREAGGEAVGTVSATYTVDETDAGAAAAPPHGGAYVRLPQLRPTVPGSVHEVLQVAAAAAAALHTKARATTCRCVTRVRGTCESLG